VPFWPCLGDCLSGASWHIRQRSASKAHSAPLCPWFGRSARRELVTRIRLRRALAALCSASVMSTTYPLPLLQKSPRCVVALAIRGPISDRFMPGLATRRGNPPVDFRLSRAGKARMRRNHDRSYKNESRKQDKRRSWPTTSICGSTAGETWTASLGNQCTVSDSNRTLDQLM
jgi:hypothetical protein